MLLEPVYAWGETRPGPNERFQRGSPVLDRQRGSTGRAGVQSHTPSHSHTADCGSSPYSGCWCRHAGLRIVFGVLLSPAWWCPAPGICTYIRRLGPRQPEQHTALGPETPGERESERERREQSDLELKATIEL